MKIVFICGSLEPGKDGVGDYVRRLASELITLGNKVGAVALNDRNIDKMFSGIQEGIGASISVLRIPSSYLYKEQTKMANKWIDEFNPDWVSLQYVPFSFQLKGLPFRFGSKLAKISKGRYLHIMFHELWVGMDVEAPIKHLLWGFVQRKLIKALVRKTKPDVIHTQTHLYIEQLKRLSLKADFLPLFSNIQVVNNTCTYLGNDIVSPQVKISFILFASIQPGAPVNFFAKDVKEFAYQNNIDVSITFLGRNGAEQNCWIEACKANGIDVVVLGEQSDEQISNALHSATYGISTTPIPQLEKSGAVAAMLEHGLPVICVARPWHPKNVKKINIPYGVYEYKGGDLPNFFSQNSHTVKSSNIIDVAQQLLNSLHLAKV
jgi:hypothetical protein